MIHQPIGGAQGQATEIEIAAEHILKTKEKMNEVSFDIFISIINDFIQETNSYLIDKYIQKIKSRDNFIPKKYNEKISKRN